MKPADERGPVGSERNSGVELPGREGEGRLGLGRPVAFRAEEQSGPWGKKGAQLVPFTGGKEEKLGRGEENKEGNGADC